ncbi:CHAD domain-containing protein [Amycolatopsis sp. NPDC051372]|uniref:CYTH and CHAD domain-containing protein n=1 Tax=Amycolatopsis sp. NPDC051372 TaxID=3155669 RepID=UPI00343C205C
MTVTTPATSPRPAPEYTLLHYGIHYYDTADLRLRRHGLTLSRVGTSWQLDRGDGRGCRVEAPESDQVPHELRRLVRAYSRDLELTPVTGPCTGRLTRDALPRDTARATVLGYLETQIEALARADLAVRLGEPEGVHDLRAAARRLRAALWTFAPVLGGRRMVRGLCAALLRLGASVGPAWDTEVQRRRFLRRLGELSDEAILGPVRADAQRHFGVAAEESAVECAEALDSHRYLQLLNAFEVLGVVLREQPRADQRKAALKPARAVLPGLVWTVVTETDERLEAAFAGSAPNAVHAVRKSAKRLRYALEAAADALPFVPDRVLADCRAVQDLLGEHRDATVARGELHALASAATEAGDPVATYELLITTEALAAQECLAALPAAWETLRRGLEPMRG